MIRPNSYHRKKPFPGRVRPSMADLLVPTEPACSRCGGPATILRTREEWHGKRFVRVAAALVCPCCSGDACPHRKRDPWKGLGFSAFFSSAEGWQDDRVGMKMFKLSMVLLTAASLFGLVAKLATIFQAAINVAGVQ